MNNIGDLVGEICKIVFLVKHEYYIGNPSSKIAICTLGSIQLLEDLKNSEAITKAAIIGRLFSENKGIDALVRYINKNQNIKKIILCGKDVWGHKSGHSLMQLYKNGTDTRQRIIGSASPNPYLSISDSEIRYFQTQIDLRNMIGETRVEKILDEI